MLRKTFLLFVVLILTPSFAFTETIDVQIKGVDDGVRTTKQRDYKEAVLFAKREAVERAGIKVKALTTAKYFVIHSDYIELIASTPDLNSKEVGRDGSFIKYANGVVYDKNTGLEWFAGPDKDTNWNRATKWVKRVQVAGGGWRMPTRKELETLYEKDVGTRNMTPLLKTTGWWVWTGKTRGSSSAWAFYLFYGGLEDWRFRDDSSYGRGFAVRFRR